MGKKNDGENMARKLEAALEGRPGAEPPQEEVPDNPTMDEVLQQSSVDAWATENLSQPPQEENREPPKRPMSPMIQETTSPTSMSLIPAEGTPASMSDPQPANDPSTQASLQSPPTPRGSDPNLRRLKEFLSGPEFNRSWVEQHLTYFANVPHIIPSPSLWDLRVREEIPQAVCDILKDRYFVIGVWPQVQIVLGDCVDNVVWCAEVATTIALFEYLYQVATALEIE